MGYTIYDPGVRLILCQERRVSECKIVFLLKIVLSIIVMVTKFCLFVYLSVYFCGGPSSVTLRLTSSFSGSVFCTHPDCRPGIYVPPEGPSPSGTFYQFMSDHVCPGPEGSVSVPYPLP